MISDKKTLRKCDVAFGTLLVILSAVFFVLAYNMPILASIGRTSAKAELSTAPGLLPMVISASLFFMGIILVVSALREGGRITREDLQKVIVKLKSGESKRMFLIAVIIIVYAFGLLTRLDFTLATFIYMAVFLFLFKATHPVKVILISGLTAVLIWFFFGQVALIPLP